MLRVKEQLGPAHKMLTGGTDIDGQEHHPLRRTVALSFHPLDACDSTSASISTSSLHPTTALTSFCVLAMCTLARRRSCARVQLVRESRGQQQR